MNAKQIAILASSGPLLDYEYIKETDIYDFLTNRLKMPAKFEYIRHRPAIKFFDNSFGNDIRVYYVVRANDAINEVIAEKWTYKSNDDFQKPTVTNFALTEYMPQDNKYTTALKVNFRTFSMAMFHMLSYILRNRKSDSVLIESRNESRWMLQMYNTRAGHAMFARYHKSLSEFDRRNLIELGEMKHKRNFVDSFCSSRGTTVDETKFVKKETPEELNIKALKLVQKVEDNLDSLWKESPEGFEYLLERLTAYKQEQMNGK